MPESETDDLVDFEEQLGRRQRRKMIVGMVIVAAVLAGVILSYVVWPNPPKPRCDDKQAQALLKSNEIPAGAVHLACRLPGPLTDTLKATLSAPPSYRKLLVYKMVAEHPKLLTPVCPNVRKGLREAIGLAPAEQAGAFLKHCDLSETGIAPPSQLAGAALHRIVLAVAVYSALKRSDPKWSTKLARRMLR